MIKDILKLLKIKHYIKNLIVFVPLLFSRNFANIHLGLRAVVCFMVFCLISSAVYIYNDIIDKDTDSKHPIKKFRPIASSKVSLKTAWILFTLILLMSIYLSLKLNLQVFFIIISYLILNIFYSIYFKKMAIIDVVCITSGFILRILAGCSVITVQPSPLVILLTFFTGMFFTFAKRKLEYQLITDKTLCRTSIKNYNISLLNQYVGINAILSIAFYFTYMLDGNTIKLCKTKYLYITAIPFTIIIYRLLYLIYTNNRNDDIAVFIYKDKPLHYLFIFYISVLVFILCFT